jgi:hypothetical protein
MSPSTRRVDTVNYVLGTQTIGVKYKFTEKTSLVETAERIHEMGANILKFSLSKRSMGDLYSLPKDDSIQSLVELASKEPSVKAVLDMPFAYYHIWVYSFAYSDVVWSDGLSGEAIPLLARVLGLADALDAMMSPRRYRPARSRPEIDAVIAAETGKQFDPSIVAAFMGIRDQIYPPIYQKGIGDSAYHAIESMVENQTETAAPLPK